MSDELTHDQVLQLLEHAANSSPRTRKIVLPDRPVDHRYDFLKVYREPLPRKPKRHEPGDESCRYCGTWGMPCWIRGPHRAACPARPTRASNPDPVLLTCPHCGKVGTGQGMRIWHFNRCRRLPP
jgi:hypothetical protein